MRKLDQNKVKENVGMWKASIPAHQVAVFTMAGGGMLGTFAAEQPADFYIDDRVGRLPYPKREIRQAVETLVTLAKESGYDPYNMPSFMRFHNCGVF